MDREADRERGRGRVLLESGDKAESLACLNSRAFSPGRGKQKHTPDGLAGQDHTTLLPSVLTHASVTVQLCHLFLYSSARALTLACYLYVLSFAFAGWGDLLGAGPRPGEEKEKIRVGLSRRDDRRVQSPSEAAKAKGGEGG